MTCLQRGRFNVLSHLVLFCLVFYKAQGIGPDDGMGGWPPKGHYGPPSEGFGGSGRYGPPSEQGFGNHGPPAQQQPKPDVSKIVFVTEIPRAATEDDVKDYMSQFGQVEKVTMRRDPRGRSFGFCHVTFVTKEGAQQAVDSELPTRSNAMKHPYTIQSVTPPRSQTPNKTVIVKNIPYGNTENDVKDYMTNFGPVEKAETPKDRMGRPLGFVRVTFVSAQGAERALDEGHYGQRQYYSISEAPREVEVAPHRSPPGFDRGFDRPDGFGHPGGF